MAGIQARTFREALPKVKRGPGAGAEWALGPSVLGTEIGAHCEAWRAATGIARPGREAQEMNRTSPTVLP